MTDALSTLYQETILDHGRRPRNRRSLTGATHRAGAQNPLCGDKIIAELRIDSRGRVEDAAFDGQGCAIAIASASLMTETIKNRTLADVSALSARLQTLLSGTGSEDLDGLGDLAVLAAVRAFPSRRKCALLAWEALAAALDGD